MKNILFFAVVMIFMTVAIAAEAVAETETTANVEADSRTIVKKQDKRGINSIGYGYGSSALGYDGIGLGYGSGDTLNGYLTPVALSKVNYVSGSGLGFGYPGYGNTGYSGIGRYNPSIGYNNGYGSYNRGYGGYNNGYGTYSGYNGIGYSGLGNGYSSVGYTGYPRVAGLGGYSYSTPLSTSYAQNGGYYY